MPTESPKHPIVIIPEATSKPSGNLSMFTPMGEGLYGFEATEHDPIVEAPITSAEGGTLYFGNEIKKEELLALTNIMGIRTNPNTQKYIIYEMQSDNSISDRYLLQWRFVSDFASKYLFRDDAPDAIPVQPFSIPEAMWKFIEGEKIKYGTMFGNPAIAGKLGGNGYSLQEELAFGVTVENPYYGVYRIWSRPWLVGK